MVFSADRVSGAFFLLFGLAMYFYVNPNYIESIEEGNIAPDSLPNIVAIVIAVCGGLLMLKPTAQRVRDPRSMAKAGIYVAILAASIYAMSWFGFVYVAPVLALVIMLLIGERRVFWLALGAVGMPAIIWFLVIHVLGRSLP